ncbi:hypothetical protein NW752_004336 [Fusarium irregulare]|uniref:Uncharacterized protein n=1 Tax=Fusarium irregulare TaxID=2494466 RepID=A0A9W8PNR0_9HYPO|nr:hypothetical protein NW766_007242 [Fusarium irregulare]KAJ4021329.1 hypothetical protein NW752_004336 [Fusarium irregulare]
MSQYSTGHDHAAPAPDAKYEHRMRYPKRAQSPASPRLDSRSLPPGELPPGSLPPGVLPAGSLPPGVVPPNIVPPSIVPPDVVPPRVVPPGPVPDRSTRPIRPPPVPSTVINEPYVKHDDKMQYPKPAPSAARHRFDNIWGTCKKPGGCDKHVEDKPPPVPTTMNPVKPSVQPSPDNHVEKVASESFMDKRTMMAVCIPCGIITCGLLWAVAGAAQAKVKSMKKDEEEPEDEDED